MKGKSLLIAIAFGIFVPSLVFSVAEDLMPLDKEDKDNAQHTLSATETIQSSTEPTMLGELISVLQPDGTTVILDMEEYLIGVLLGEMPMDFHQEALKAQAVVARTYAFKRATTGQKHSFGSVCTEAACCQAYCSVTQYLQSGGSRDALKNAISAVVDTSGQVLLYNGALIEATYFSCSGGRTEDAVAVWGNDIPYLQAVDSPGEENATHYMDTVSFSGVEFADRLGIRLEGMPVSWFGGITYTDGGGVDKMMIGGIWFRGTELRQKLELCSTAFSVAPIGDTIFVTTKGFGHRVGMSQYGAEAMAVSGENYESILAHYYPGTSLMVYQQN